MADQDHIPQVKLFDQLIQICGIGIHVIAVPSLVRSSVSSSVNSNAAVTIRGHEKHLIFKCIGRKRPSMIEQGRLSFAPVLVVHRHPIFRSDSAHSFTSIFLFPKYEASPGTSLSALGDYS